MSRYFELPRAPRAAARRFRRLSPCRRLRADAAFGRGRSRYRHLRAARRIKQRELMPRWQRAAPSAAATQAARCRRRHKTAVMLCRAIFAARFSFASHFAAHFPSPICSASSSRCPRRAALIRPAHARADACAPGSRRFSRPVRRYAEPRAVPPLPRRRRAIFAAFRDASTPPRCRIYSRCATAGLQPHAERSQSSRCAARRRTRRAHAVMLMAAPPPILPRRRCRRAAAACASPPCHDDAAAQCRQ